MPILKMAGSAVLRVKPVISPKTVSDSEWPRSRIYKKIFPATQNSPFGKNIGARNGPERSFHLLFVSSYSSAIFSFSTNYFSTPPGVCLNKKSPSHFCTGVLLIFPTILLVWVAWVSSRRSSRTGPLTPHSCTWPSRFVDQPCAAFPAPSDTASSPSRH